MRGILFWIVPPLVGAVIGYVTNAVAVKMLFRPLREIRVFGIRLPFTPGILPKERHKLAESIGRMVEQELLTPGVLRERLANSDVRGKIGSAIGTYTDTTLDKPLSYWLDERHQDLPMAKISRNFVDSNIFDFFLEEIIRIWVRRKSWFFKEDPGGIGSWVKNQVKNFSELLIPKARDIIKDDIVRGIRDNTRSNQSDFRQALEKIITIYPGISLRDFLSLGKTEKQQVDSFLALKAVDTMDENIENALSSINVRLLVSDRINSLDMIRVEKIILDVMAGQLKWINFFGGILGAFIGFVQVILSLLI